MAAQKPKTASSILQKFTRDPSYVSRMQGLDEEATGRDWDNRFTTNKIPQYDAFNDRYCKFSMRRRAPSSNRSKGPPPNPMNAWASGTMPGASSGAERLPQLQHPSGGNAAVAKSQSADLEAALGAPGQSVEQMFTKAKQRIIRLWDELGVAEAQRMQFAHHAMSLPTIDNVAVINDEIQKLLDRRNAAVQVEKTIEVREGFLYLLQELAERYSNGVVDKDRGLRELLSLVSPFRSACLDVVESIVRWRETLRTSTNPPYLWKGVSYLHKMNSDLFFLVHSRVGLLLDFEVRNNALLDPRKQVESVAPGKLAPIRRSKDLKDLPKERLDKAERVLVEELQRQHHLQLLRAQGGEADVMVVAEEAHLSKLAKDEEEQQQLIIEEDEWLQQQQREAKMLDAQSKAAVKVQKTYRGFVARKVVGAKIRQRLAVIKMQTIARQFIAKCRVEQLRKKVNAAKKLQALHRGASTRGRIENIRRHHDAATAIQRVFRGHVGRKYADLLGYLRDCARKIQALWRGHVARQFVIAVVRGQRVRAATRIQAVWRGVVVRSNPMYSSARVKCAIRIQAWVRGILDREIARRMMLERRTAIRLQSWWRMLRAQRLAMKLIEANSQRDWQKHLDAAHMAATKIQSLWRMVMGAQRVSIIRERRLSSLAQAALHQTLLEAELNQTRYLAQSAAAVNIQRVFRGMLGRRRVSLILTLNFFATQIQRVVRGRLGRIRASQQRDRLADEMPAIFKMTTDAPDATMSIVEESIRSIAQQESAREKIAQEAAALDAAQKAAAQQAAQAAAHQEAARVAAQEAAAKAAAQVAAQQEAARVAAQEAAAKAAAQVAAQQEAAQQEAAAHESARLAQETVDASAIEVDPTSDASMIDTSSVAPAEVDAIHEKQSIEYSVRPAMHREDTPPVCCHSASTDASNLVPVMTIDVIAPTEPESIGSELFQQLQGSDENPALCTEPKAEEQRTLKPDEGVETSQTSVRGVAVVDALTTSNNDSSTGSKTVPTVAAQAPPGSEPSASCSIRASCSSGATPMTTASEEAMPLAPTTVIPEETVLGVLANVALTTTVASMHAESKSPRNQEVDYARSVLRCVIGAYGARRAKQRVSRSEARVSAVQAIKSEKAFAAQMIANAARRMSLHRSAVTVETQLSDHAMAHERAFAASTIQKAWRLHSLLDDLRYAARRRVQVAEALADEQVKRFAVTHIQCATRSRIARGVRQTLTARRAVAHDDACMQEQCFSAQMIQRLIRSGQARLIARERSNVKPASEYFRGVLQEQTTAATVIQCTARRFFARLRVESLRAQRHVQRVLERNAVEEPAVLPAAAEVAEVEVAAASSSAAEASFNSSYAAEREQLDRIGQLEAELRAERDRTAALEEQLARPQAAESLPSPPTTVASCEPAAADAQPEVSSSSAACPTYTTNVASESSAPLRDVPLIATVEATVQPSSCQASRNESTAVVTASRESDVSMDDREVSITVNQPEAADASVLHLVPEQHPMQQQPTPIHSEAQAARARVTANTSNQIIVGSEHAVSPAQLATLICSCLRYVQSAEIVSYWREKNIRARWGRMRNAAALRIQCLIRAVLAKRRLATLRQMRIYAIQEGNEEAMRRNRELIAARQLQLARTEVAHQAALIKEEQERTRRQELAILDELHRRDKAAMAIQCAYRCYNARFMLDWKRRERHQKRIAQERVDFANIAQHAAIKIQRTIRRFVASRLVQRLREDKLAQRQAVARREALRHVAAVKIQCMYRVHNAKFEVGWRRDERRLREEREATIKRSAELRALDALRDKEMLLRLAARQAQAAVTLQCAWRCYNARFELMWRVEARAKASADAQLRKVGMQFCRVVQRLGRGYLARKRQYHERAFAHTLAAQELLLAEYEADSVINAVLNA